ncbi:MAG: peptidoglycan bridge formation glycyltransferase FemA/FemB family protein [bacterium]|nr:peptidoglycan bridge formation glycyltransferase FemA/FemB family protein [bacterium]
MESSFLQTKEWAQFQESLGRRTFFIYGEPGRIAQESAWSALLIRHDLPLGKNYLYCPRGPIIGELRIKKIEEFLSRAARIAKEEGSIFLRWDVPFVKNSQFEIRNSQFLTYPIKSVQPQHTIVIDLAKPEDEILAEMHEKTRYNVRLAERRGVLVKQVPAESGIKTFWELLKQTAERDDFSSHHSAHYEKLAKTFSESQNETLSHVRMYVAEYMDMPLAAALIMFHDGTATYLHGASSNKNRDVMAPHLLHWYIMRDAKGEGCDTYDLWGIDDRNPHWAGITRFKRGFGGNEFSYANSYDIVFNRTWYGMYRVAKKFL